MEAVQVRGGSRPVLTVVADSPKFSALPHEVIRDTRLSRDARLLYAVLQMHWWQGAESYASHAEMAAEMGCSLSGIRRYLDELIAVGLIEERPCGIRRAKVYIRLPIRQNDGIERASNASGVNDCGPSNASKPTGQYVKTDSSNASKTTHSYKKTPEKKTPEEDSPPTGEGAAVAADPPAPKATDAQKRAAARAKATPCPDEFPLTDRHLAYAAEFGFDAEQALEHTARFLAHHRFKGTKGVDWYAGWQGWIRRQREIDNERASRAPSHRSTQTPQQPSAPRPGSLAARTKSERFGG